MDLRTVCAPNTCKKASLCEGDSFLGTLASPVDTLRAIAQRSLGMTVRAYWGLSRACHQEMLPGTPWSMAHPQHALRLRRMTHQVKHKGKTQLVKAHKAASALAVDQGDGIFPC